MTGSWLPQILPLLLWSAVTQSAVRAKQVAVHSVQLQIETTWDGDPVESPTCVKLTKEPAGLGIEVDAKFWNDPTNPGGKAGQPFFKLWNYEVVELFLLNDKGLYVEIELAPWGQHIVLLLDNGKDVRHSLPIIYEANRSEGRWTGKAVIDQSYLPPNITKLNAYAIHGSGENRVYEALHPAPKGVHEGPSFHRLQYFKPIDLSQIVEQKSLSLVWVDAMIGRQSYSISNTWDGKPIDHGPAQLSFRGTKDVVEISITAPYFGDPAPPGGKPGEAYFKLWDYEVVEAFFLNDKEQYLELEFGPHGQHLSLLLNGNRNAIKHTLPMDYSANIIEDKKVWTGFARVPIDYFPPNVSLFNAYAIHGTEDDRVYEALYESSGPQPDFHRLEKFQPIDFQYILPDNKAAKLSPIWEMSIAESNIGKPAQTASQSFSIKKTWDDKPIDHTPVEVKLNYAEDNLVIQIKAPFFDDPAPENGKVGEAFYKLWDYEVVEAFFLNAKDQYLELEFGPHGQHLLLLLDGNRNAIKHSLPLDYSAVIDKVAKSWTGTARIPVSYFPPDVSLFNAYAIHGTGEDRVYEALYEVSGPQADFHRLNKFQEIDLSTLIPGNKGAKLPAIWEMSIAESNLGNQDHKAIRSFKIERTWDDKPIDHEAAEVTLMSAEDDLIIKVAAPFFDDPAPEGKKGEAFFKLWDYEVVEAFFLNDKEQYLELEFGPHGQHLSLLLNGNRNSIKHSLPLDYTAIIDKSSKTWTGMARIPAGYFPPDVSKFNAYAIHGTKDNRIYEALHEVSGPQADFHRLEKFKELDFDYFMPKNKGSNLSALWQTAIAESNLGRNHISYIDFKIEKTWDNKSIDHEPAEVKLISAEGELIIQMKAPFFDDPAPEDAEAGQAFYKLWDYEVVEAFFLNDKNQYLELEFGPHGQHLSLLLNGNRNAVKHSLPLEFSATINKDEKVWTGEARIPASYFPPNVSKFNAYAIHGVEPNRMYEALYEVSGPQPDFHRLDKFQPLNLETIMEENKHEELSAVWKQAIGESELTN
eukprot:GFUD01008231.1.p1 GENE.GFUD01008231.1~~GFUD01008231.1.p1  ORF type:complete len:1056 (+),score=227.00 GFUD01008231.1:78-3170(+)